MENDVAKSDVDVYQTNKSVVQMEDYIYQRCVLVSTAAATSPGFSRLNISCGFLAALNLLVPTFLCFLAFASITTKYKVYGKACKVKGKRAIYTIHTTKSSQPEHADRSERPH